MSDNVWNYDLKQCPTEVPVLVELKNGRIFVCLKKEDNFRHMDGLSLHDSREVAKWDFIHLPAEPEIWIKHDNNSFPKCHPRDEVKVICEKASSPNMDIRLARDWDWNSPSRPISEYCIVKRHEK